MPAGYEFSEMENSTIRGTARYARIWGILQVLVGLLVGLLLLGSVGAILFGAQASMSSQALWIGAALVFLGPMALVYLSVGWFYISAGGSLGSVVDTQGNDVEFLMRALGRLSLAFFVEAIFTIVGAVLATVAAILMLLG
jgi:hypothetical protein